jgi:6-hydroxy-3-succinoylpyridine 3-monooxygenase
VRTRIYIDGYNLYYGCLKRTSLKWLDLMALFERQILPSIAWQGKPLPAALEAIAIKFFTAPILEKAAKASDSLACQEQYHSALRKHLPGRVQLITGYYALTQARAKAVNASDAHRWPRYCQDVDVWKLEEKQTDVNLAVHALKDALCDEVDQVVIVTNDTDIAPAVEMIRQLTGVLVGLVVPTTAHQRRPNDALAKHTHWIRTHITLSELQAAQLPRVVTHGKKSAIKPLSRYAHSDVLRSSLDLAVAVRGNQAAAFKWLTLPNAHFDGRSPLELIEAGDGQQVIDYQRDWTAQTPSDEGSAPDPVPTRRE